MLRTRLLLAGVAAVLGVMSCSAFVHSGTAARGAALSTNSITTCKSRNTGAVRHQRGLTTRLAGDSGDDRRQSRVRDEPEYIPFSGLEGKDVSKLKGAEKRDADWFMRQAEREKNGELSPLEDPVFYIALFTLAPIFGIALGIAACYIPIGCAPDY